jgi:hypothetical protein
LPLEAEVVWEAPVVEVLVVAAVVVVLAVVTRVVVPGRHWLYQSFDLVHV